MQDKIARLLLETAADRWITELQKDTARSARKLAEFGDLMARSNRQHHFFDNAQRLLSRRDSGYYDFAQRLAVSVDRDVLKTFGMNFGFNSLAKGAKKIASYEEETGAYLPWTVGMELSDGADGFSLQRRLIEEGESLGIYTYFMDASQYSGDPDALISLCLKFSNSAFFLFCGAPFLLKTTELASAANTIFLVDLTDSCARSAAARLRENRRLWGYWLSYDNASAEEVIGGGYLPAIEGSECDVLFFCNLPGTGQETIQRMRSYVDSLRAQDCPGYFACEAQSDVLYVDSTISPAAHAIFLRADGSTCCAPANSRPLHFEGSLRELAARAAT